MASVLRPGLRESGHPTFAPRSRAESSVTRAVDTSHTRKLRELYLSRGKRLLDLSIVLVILPLVLPVYLIIAAIIIAVDGRPVHHRSERLRAGGRTFSVLKFRTMCRDGDAELERLISTNEELFEEFKQSMKLQWDPRVTRLGRVLRRWSLDELPQLLNVMKGDMSMVGPRPITRKEWEEYYGDKAPVVFRSRPGLTGLWQISGRSLLPYEKRIELDMEYSDRCALLMDLHILMRTIPAVLRGRGAC